MVAGLRFPKLLCLEETINCRTEEARSIATFDVSGLKATLSNIKPSGALGLKLAGRNWHVVHSRPSGDTELQWRRGSVTVTQAVPRANWFLIPSPAIKVTQQRTFSQPGRDDVATSLVLDHNTLLARTRLTGAIYGGPDRAYKAVVHLDSLTGSTVTARAKLRHPFVHSVSATVNDRRGPVLAAKSKCDAQRCLLVLAQHLGIIPADARAFVCRPYNGLKVEAAFDQQKNAALASVTYLLPKDGKHTQLKADILMPVKSLRSVPQVVLGIKWHF